jgi:DNA-binding GntR family transcriptional regulator
MAHGLDHGGHRQLKDAVYLQLRDEIISGALAAGAVLREAELVTRFGVSKTPLRDALVRLQKDGFVDIPPYRSAVVVGYSPTDLREIYELRELLEGACARQAALHISSDALATLAEIVQASSACVSGGETIPGREEELTELIQQFDLALYAQSRNSRIDEMVDNIRGHVQRIGRLTTGIPGRLAKSVSEHQAIYEAIAHGDGTAAETLMRRHINSVLADQLLAQKSSSKETSPVTPTW